MIALCFIAFQIFLLVQGFIHIRKLYQWGWSKLAFAIAFGLFECVLIIAPVKLADPKLAAPVFLVCFVMAILNCAWFIYVVMHWKLPDGRNSLEVLRDERRQKQS